MTVPTLRPILMPLSYPSAAAATRMRPPVPAVAFGADTTPPPSPADSGLPPGQPPAPAADAAPPKTGWLGWLKAKAMGAYHYTRDAFLWAGQGSVEAAKGTGKVVTRPFQKLKPMLRLKNAWDNAWGYPRHAKILKATMWAAATFMIGLIPIPGFQALIAAAPITFLTTLLVDLLVGFGDGLTKDPDAMRSALDAQRNPTPQP